MTKKSLIIITVLFLLCAGFCAGCVLKQAATPVDRALTYVYQYEALEDTYKSQYTFASEAEREWMVANVAPMLDQLRFSVAQYARLASTGLDDVDARLEIIRLSRIAALRLARELTEEEKEVSE